MQEKAFDLIYIFVEFIRVLACVDNVYLVVTSAAVTYPLKQQYLKDFRQIVVLISVESGVLQVAEIEI
jgi:hypothetical protein